MNICDYCKDWGPTTTNWNAISCPRCKRLTYPNLGINLPAGAAVSLGAVNCINILLEQKELSLFEKIKLKEIIDSNNLVNYSIDFQYNSHLKEISLINNKDDWNHSIIDCDTIPHPKRKNLS